LSWVPDYSGTRETWVSESELKEMRSICAGCDHLVECREFAMNNPAVVGIWGGMTSMERRAARLTDRRF